MVYLEVGSEERVSPSPVYASPSNTIAAAAAADTAAATIFVVAVSARIQRVAEQVVEMLCRQQTHWRERGGWGGGAPGIDGSYRERGVRGCIR